MKFINILLFALFFTLSVSCDSKLDYSDSKIEFYDITTVNGKNNKSIISSDTLFKSDSDDIIIQFITQSSNDFPTKIYLETNKVENIDITDTSPGAVSISGGSNETGYRTTYESELKNLKYMGDTLNFKIVIGDNLLSDNIVVVID